jgi:predicted GNAT superfamily acetyltransferase
VNDVKWQAGWPVSSEPRLDLEAPELLLEVPPEWDVLCGAAPRVAEDWQGKVRRAFQTYLGRGYVAVDLAPTREGGRRRPLYVLARP